MTVARSVADVLTDHTVFEVECIDRMYLNVYVPQLQYAAGLVGYVHRQLGLPIASTAPLGRISDAFTADIRRFARERGVPWVDFARGQRKDDVMAEQLAGFTAPEGVVFIGRAQEKNSVFRTERRHNAEGRAYPWIVRSTGVINQFYCYCVDADFGPFFLKFSSYFPYNASCASTATTGPSGRPPTPRSGSPPWTTGSPRWTTPRGCRRSATGWAPIRSTPCCGSGWRSCPTRSPQPTGPRATATTSRCCRPSSPSPRCSTPRCRGGCSSKTSSATTSTPGAPIRSG